MIFKVKLVIDVMNEEDALESIKDGKLPIFVSGDLLDGSMFIPIDDFTFANAEYIDYPTADVPNVPKINIPNVALGCFEIIGIQAPFWAAQVTNNILTKDDLLIDTIRGRFSFKDLIYQAYEANFTVKGQDKLHL